MALRMRSWEARSSLAPTNTSLSNLRETGRERVGASEVRVGTWPARIKQTCSRGEGQAWWRPAGQGAYLPGRRRAGSRRSGLLVAPITNTSPVLWSPSSSAKSCETTLESREGNYSGAWSSVHPTCRGLSWQTVQWRPSVSTVTCSWAPTLLQLTPSTCPVRPPQNHGKDRTFSLPPPRTPKPLLLSSPPPHTPVHHSSRVSTLAPIWGQGIQLIEEDDAWGCRPGSGKHWGERGRGEEGSSGCGRLQLRDEELAGSGRRETWDPCLPTLCLSHLPAHSPHSGPRTC